MLEDGDKEGEYMRTRGSRVAAIVGQGIAVCLQMQLINSTSLACTLVTCIYKRLTTSNDDKRNTHLA